jgi:hypothetical protein
MVFHALAVKIGLMYEILHIIVGFCVIKYTLYSDNMSK